MYCFVDVQAAAMGFQEHGLAFQVITDGGGGATAAPWWAAAAAPQGFAAKFPIISSGEFLLAFNLVDLGRWINGWNLRQSPWRSTDVWADVADAVPAAGRCGYLTAPL
jgi:hypothetical protein